MNHQENRVIRRTEVKTATGFSDSSLDREIRAGRFPRPFRLSSDPKCRAVGWSWIAVQKWIADRETDGPKVAA